MSNRSLYALRLGVALLDHLTSCCLAGVESAFDVYIEGSCVGLRQFAVHQVGILEFGCLPRENNSCIGHHNIYGTVWAGFDRGIEQADLRFPIRDIAVLELKNPFGMCHSKRSHELLASFVRNITDHNIGTMRSPMADHVRAQAISDCLMVCRTSPILNARVCWRCDVVLVMEA